MLIRETTIVQYRPVVKLQTPAGMSDEDAYKALRGIFWLLANEYHEAVSDFYYSGEMKAHCIDGDPVEDRAEAEGQYRDLVGLLEIEVLPADWKVIE